MKLNEYKELLINFTRYYRTEGTVECALNNQEDGTPQLQDWAIDQIHTAIKKHRDALGISLAASGDEDIDSQEIDETKLRRHIADLRSELKSVIEGLPEDERKMKKELMVRMLEDLTLRAGIKDLGKVFEKNPRIQKHQNEEAGPETTEAPGNTDIEALMARLRAEGKIQ